MVNNGLLFSHHKLEGESFQLILRVTLYFIGRLPPCHYHHGWEFLDNL